LGLRRIEIQPAFALFGAIMRGAGPRKQRHKVTGAV
jgi:hypothetical protein